MKAEISEMGAMRMLAFNPDDSGQARVFYCFYEAAESHEHRHPQKVMESLATEFGFRILARVPQSLFDGWDFWIEFNDPPELPPLFRPNICWKPVGQP